MKVEILAQGKIENSLKDMNIQYKITYSGDKYKVVELEKPDAKALNNATLEGAWCKFSNGMGGSPCDVITVNKEILIGWSAKKDSYNKLTDYVREGLKAKSNAELCDYAVGLAKANGMSLSKLFRYYEG